MTRSGRRLRRIAAGRSMQLLGGGLDCPECRCRLDGLTPATGSFGHHSHADLARTANRARPTVGSYTVCGYCGALLQFTANMELAAAAAETMDPVLRDLYATLQRSIRRMKD